MPLAQGQFLETALFGAIASTEDTKEGTAAFLEKRKAAGKGVDPLGKVARAGSIR